MTGVVAFLIVGFSPGLFWLWIIYQRDKYLPAPVSLVIRTFVWGIVASIPIAVVAGLLSLGINIEDGHASLVSFAYVAFVVAGGVEEFGKFLVIRRTVYTSPYLRDPKDGLIFAAAAALGFASLENVVYMLNFGWEVILLRGPVSTLAHVAFSGLWGAAMGFDRSHPKTHWAPYGLVGAMALHGAFDFFIFSGSEFVSFLLFIAGALTLFLLLRWAVSTSGRARPISHPSVSCPACHTEQAGFAKFCTDCGQALAALRSSIRATCSVCGAPVSLVHHFCSACGGRLAVR